eukprot:CAMPEP_0183532736 /NCGR_PEP_ID=MMETSP0371-20130417/25732_1 /TAXON_ID=268820 /ORGANISM="Peridinium aciculiferum, Strain PAER-2" /LENGTH=39 /DNA_ID= /DNA_START= /DNA_END= /DNA_ORIENTATION=
MTRSSANPADGSMADDNVRDTNPNMHSNPQKRVMPSRFE